MTLDLSIIPPKIQILLIDHHRCIELFFSVLRYLCYFFLFFQVKNFQFSSCSRESQPHLPSLHTKITLRKNTDIFIQRQDRTRNIFSFLRVNCIPTDKGYSHIQHIVTSLQAYSFHWFLWNIYHRA